jgi:hypothetical protein
MTLLEPKMPKPATPEPKRVPPSDGLVFWAKWSDGIETRMSVYTFINNLDVKRAMAVSAAAYSSRKRVPMAAITTTIVQARFEDLSGAIVESYNAEQLSQAASTVEISQPDKAAAKTS